MRGIPMFNFPAFEEAAETLRYDGWHVYSPRENDAEKGAEPSPTGEPVGDIPFKLFMREDLWQVCDSDAVFLLPNWENSKGVGIERFVADSVGVPVYSYPDGELIEPFAGTSVGPPPPDDFGPSWRETSEQGTSKGRREAIFSMIPVYALAQEARVHGNSVVPKEGESAKYADTEPGVPNWSHGAPWSWFLDALWRHLLSYTGGRSFDPESGLHNLAHVRWMCGWLMEAERLGLGVDDRRVQV